MPRLSRLRLASIGHPKARFHDLVLDFRDRHRATDSTVWLRNGGGKSSLLNLFFSLVRPSHGFFGGSARRREKRSLDDYVLADDRSVVAAEWELDGAAGDEPERLITGVLFEWRAGLADDEGRLRKLFFMGRVDEDEPRLTLDGLPLVSEGERGERRRRTLMGFKQEWAALRVSHPHLGVVSTEVVREWIEWLDAAGIDPELFKYQTEMNRREGSADELFRFEEHEQFIDFLLRMAMDPRAGEKVGRNIATFRRELRERALQHEPESRLVDGLATRMEPLVALQAERQELGDRIGGTRAELGALRGLVGSRHEAITEEMARRAAEAEIEHAAAELARGEALAERRRAAELRLLAATRRLADARVEERRCHAERERTERAVRVLAAGIPLRNALRFERLADGYASELEQKEREHAPQLAQLRDAAHAYAGAVSLRARRLRDESKLHGEGELAARARAKEAGAAIVRNAREAALAEQRAKEIDGQLGRAGKEREQLQRRGALGPGERAANALARLDAAIAEAEARVEEHGAELAATDERLRELQFLARQAAKDEAAAEAAEQQAKDQLEVALERRRSLEGNAALMRALEVEEIDLERLPDRAIAQLSTHARGLLDRVVALRAGRADDERALSGLDANGLLPPGRDVAAILGALRARLPAAWSGFEYIEANLPARDGARRALVARAPEIAAGVVVRDDDFDKAVEILAAATGEGRITVDAPVVVAPQSSLADGAPPRGYVVGPAGDAWFDRDAAKTERARRQLRLDESERQRGELEARRAELEALVGRLGEFRRLHPMGWFRDQELRVAERRAAREAVESRSRGIRDESAALGERRVLTLRAEGEARDARVRDGRFRDAVGTYHAAHEQDEPERRQALAAARSALAEALSEKARFEAVASAAEADAAAAASRARAAGEEARALEEELCRVEYLDGPLELRREAIPVGPARDDYHRRRRSYEMQVGRDGLLQLLAHERDAAREERGKLGRLLGPELDEATVRATLDGLDDLGRLEELHREAGNRHASATGSTGAATRDANNFAKEQVAALKACVDLGANREPSDFGLEADDLDDEAATADASADAAQERERAADERALSARSVADECEARVERLGREAAQLVTLAESFADLLDLAAPTADGDAAPPGEDEVRERVKRIEQALKRHRADALRLDEARAGAAQAIRSFVAEPRFQELKADVGRRLGLHDERDLEGRAAILASELELRRTTLADLLAESAKHRDLLVTELLAVADEGLALLGSATRHSRLPDHLPGIGGGQFLRITTSTPEDPRERRGRVGELLDRLATEGEIPDGTTLVQEAVKRLARPVKVRVLNPDPTQERESVEIVELGRFSGGERLTCAILLYCTLAQLRAHGRGRMRKSSVLLLDNPIGTASRVRFLEQQREVARAMNVQLLYTTAVNDHEALRTLPNVIRLRNQRVDRNSGNRLVEEEASEGRVEAARVVRPDEPEEHGAAPSGGDPDGA